MTIQIEALYEYAKKNGMVPDLFFHEVSAVLTINLSARGIYRGFTEEVVRVVAPRINEVRTGSAAKNPRGPNSRNKARLVDGAEYTFGSNKEHFVVLLETLYQKTNASQINTILKFVSAELPLDLAEKLKTGVQGNIAFRVNGEWPYSGPELRAYYQKAKENKGVCRITGLPCIPVNTHSKIRFPTQDKNKPDYTPTWNPSTFISFNAGTSRFENKKQGQNYPLSPEVVYGYTTALNSFLARGDGRHHHSAVNIFNDTVVVFWAVSGLDMTPVLDSFHPQVKVEDLEDPVEKKKAAAQAFKEVRKTTDVGLKRWVDTRLEELVCTLTLKVNMGRIAIVDWHRIPAHKLAANLLQFRAETHRSVRQMIQSLNTNGKDKPYNIEAARTVLKGSPWPRSIENRVLQHNPIPEWLQTLKLRGTHVRSRK